MTVVLSTTRREKKRTWMVKAHFLITVLKIIIIKRTSTRIILHKDSGTLCHLLWLYSTVTFGHLKFFSNNLQNIVMNLFWDGQKKNKYLTFYNFKFFLVNLIL